MKWHLKMMVVLPIALFALTSCEFKSYEEFEPDPYDGALIWTELVRNADWGNRYDHAALSFKSKLWVVGGYNPGMSSGDTYYEDVWSSEDGVEWTEEVNKAPWQGRRGHAMVVHNDGNGEAMYLFGGFQVDETTGYRQYTNDVWRSYDGKEWSQIKERSYPPQDSLFDWFPRMEHTTLVKNIDGQDYIYLFAGRSMQEGIDGRFASIYHNDVWRSRDAINWERVQNNDYGIRGDQAATIDPESGRMYLQGGAHGFVFTAENNGTKPIVNWEYLWYSDNGKDWVAVNDTASMDQSLLYRSSHQILVYENSLWSFPGRSTSNEHYLFGGSGHYPIWRFHANGEWEVDSYGAAFDPRHAYAALVHNEKIWILGGFTSKTGQANDVWTGEMR